MTNTLKKFYGRRMGALCVMFTLAVGCGEGDKDEGLTGVRTMRGRYSNNFEDWRFKECGGSTYFAIDPNTLSATKNFALITQAQDAACAVPEGGADPCSVSSDYVTVYAKIVGNVTAPGQTGHLGKYTHAVVIQDVLEASATVPADCP